MKKHHIKKVTYTQLEAFVKYLSLCRDYQDPDPTTHEMSRKLLLDMYIRLARRHLHSVSSATFTLSFSRAEAQAICKYVGWRGATGQPHTDQVTHGFYLQLHQFTA